MDFTLILHVFIISFIATAMDSPMCVPSLAFSLVLPDMEISHSGKKKNSAVFNTIGAFPLHSTTRHGSLRHGLVRVSLRFHCSLVPL